MKTYFFYLCLLVLILPCSSVQAGNKEQEVASLESEMIDFFKKTLKQNYGSEDAVDLLVKGMNKYYFNYILEVDKRKLQKINEKLYSEGWLYSYFLDSKDLVDTCSVRIRIPKKQYMYARAQVIDMILPFKKYAPDGFSYFQKELSHASHPFLKAVVKIEDMVGQPSSSLIWGLISENDKNIRTDFKSDRDLQMYLTLYFWKYLCHSGNIDFYTGKDRTAEVMKEM